MIWHIIENALNSGMAYSKLSTRGRRCVFEICTQVTHWFDAMFEMQYGMACNITFNMLELSLAVFSFFFIKCSRDIHHPSFIPNT